MIRTIGRKKIQCSLADVKLGMLRSNRVEEMKNALITNAGPYFIPEGVIFNRPKKLRWLKELC